MKCVDQAFKLEESSALAWYVKGDILQIKKRHDEAIASYDKAIGLDNFFFSTLV
jgi:hypothetical protein